MLNRNNERNNERGHIYLILEVRKEVFGLSLLLMMLAMVFLFLDAFFRLTNFLLFLVC